MLPGARLSAGGLHELGVPFGRLRIRRHRPDHDHPGPIGGVVRRGSGSLRDDGPGPQGGGFRRRGRFVGERVEVSPKVEESGFRQFEDQLPDFVIEFAPARGGQVLPQDEEEAFAVADIADLGDGVGPLQGR
ncbi:hypothetical protein A8926_4805 [Saccharopolyspora spinosa]|uniref:Uncharacterized protein n=1 Tax=Saccharopolyspora spinosa TaxID=60894 RepID=A0A2N3Y1V9_SACSN|nr:hypothetical protein A8926_4805 [Saccharopolyspora spinosa]